jgi:hypothetical protein
MRTINQPLVALEILATRGVMAHLGQALALSRYVTINEEGPVVGACYRHRVEVGQVVGRCSTVGARQSLIKVARGGNGCGVGMKEYDGEDGPIFDCKFPSLATFRKEYWRHGPMYHCHV